GRLVHKPGGAEHARWVFDYDETAEDDDEAGYRFGNHAFRNGEYVSIRGEDGPMHTFQVASVEPAACGRGRPANDGGHFALVERGASVAANRLPLARGCTILPTARACGMV